MATRLALWRAAVGIVALALLWRVIVVNGLLFDLGGRAHLPAPAASSDDATAHAQATRALGDVLKTNPAEVAALLMWAAEVREQSPDAAERAYRLAVRLAPADRDVLGAAASFLLDRGHVPEAMQYLERLADLFPETRERAFPLLASYFFSPEGTAAWNDVVLRNPQWVAPFIVSSCESGLDPSVLAALLVKRIGAAIATDPEIACVIERLRLSGRWGEAYQLWLNSLSRAQLADVGFVYNGGFESPPLATGFDWMLQARPERETGHAAEIVRLPVSSGAHSLRVAYNGKRQAGIPAAQYLAMPPGRYEMSGMVRIERMTLGRGVHWTIRCVEAGRKGAVIAESERFIGSTEWQRFAFEAAIAEDCSGQILQLEPVGPEGSVAFAGGTVWFDDLVLRRVP